ncbi:MAG: hypothetical protein Tsb0032_22360 [Kiloniellaceae bacterium]
MTSISGGTASVLSELRQLDSRNLRLHGLSAEEVQAALSEMQALKEAAAMPSPELTAGEAAASSQVPAQVGAALLAAETGFRAQQIAQETAREGADLAALPDEEEEQSEAVKAFLDYMSKTPEERYFEAFLKSKGMTQEEFDALPVEDKKALMKEFEEFVKQSMEINSAEKVARTNRSELL